MNPCDSAVVVVQRGFEQAILTVAAHEARPKDVEELMEVPMEIFGLGHTFQIKGWVGKP